MKYEQVLKEIRSEIKKTLYGYILAKSYTYTPGEKQAEEYLRNYYAEIPYFRDHPELCGTYDIEGDPFDRKVFFGMVRGKGPKTVVLIHHSDVVGIEDFKLLKEYAFQPDELAPRLMEMKDSLPEEAREDLLSGDWIFGRGGCDMKGGGSIQLSLLKRYSEIPDFEGNVIVLSVPDEENMSAGMRAAVKLLAELKDRYGLDYRMMINSEPQQRKTAEEGIFSEGTVGKVMPFVYARGYLSHVGKVFEGFNPVNVMSEIVRRTELNMDFSDVVGDESAPPPTWLYLKDSKTVYDVSMPLSMAGCFSILTLNRTPGEILEKVRVICEESFDRILSDMRASYDRFCAVARPVARELPWERKVMTFQELVEEAEAAHGEEFRTAYGKELASLTDQIHRGELNIIECNFRLLEMVFEYVDDLSPRVVYGLIPPYYPNASNCFFEGLEADDRAGFSEKLNEFTMKEFGQRYTKEYFYTGICDLSFSGIRNSAELTRTLQETMPLFGTYYDIPFEELEKISMPCINIGPWGKDFHKLTERVYAPDLYDRTPKILHYAITSLL